MPVEGYSAQAVERFWAKVDADGDCWEWTSYRDACGYGRYRKAIAHRVSYELLVGPIPAGLEIDHLCRNRACVNPDHLEVVTHAENMRRGTAGLPGAHLTQCVKGHEFTPENTIWRPNGRRACRACMYARQSEYRERKRVAQCVPMAA